LSDPTRSSAVDRYLRRRIKTGDLVVRLGSDPVKRFGDGSGLPVEVHIDRVAVLRMMARPSSMTLGECYMDGAIRFAQGGIFDFVALVARNSKFGLIKETWFKRLLRGLRQHNDAKTARRNAAHHYDLSLDLYRRFLDADLQYSCAYFARPDMSLEEAQEAKRERIARKLLLKPGGRVLDIGCGWGGLALDLAGREDVEVLGVSLAEEQVAEARRRAKAAVLDGRARFELQDYRAVKGKFDRIVSVGMLEHVGRPNFDAYFAKIAALLDKDGVALVHSIGRKHGEGVTNPFLDKYIFPGGYIPLLSEVLPSVERAGLQVADIEMWRLHYAETLRHWRERFEAARPDMVKLYDERFCRMWEYYMSISEVAFRWAGFAVFQLQLVKTVDAVPITKDYLDAAR
jgi:cyclopropane-fatty-acyl-phospholipid synthase